MRQNKPALIDPTIDTVQARTAKRLGRVSERNMLDELDEHARRISGLNRELQELRSLLGQSDPIINFSEYGDLRVPATASIVLVEGASNPGASAGPAAGSSPSAVSFPRGGSDVAGQVRITTGASGTSTGTLISITFTKPKATTDYLVFLTPASSGAGPLQLREGSKTTSGFQIICHTAPATATQLDINYLVVETPPA